MSSSGASLVHKSGNSPSASSAENANNLPGTASVSALPIGTVAQTTPVPGLSLFEEIVRLVAGNPLAMTAPCATLGNMNFLEDESNRYARKYSFPFQV